MVKIGKTRALKIFAWSLSVAALLVAILGWGQGVRWHIAGISSYQLFPLFGLIAFGLMWSHYIVSVTRLRLGIDKSELKLYVEVTGWIVLFAIIMHPGLLEWQLWRDGFGLPPGSVLQSYVAPSLRLFAVFGMVSLFLFLAYELRHWFDRKHWWRAVEVGTDIAMVAIFIHALKLGTQLQHGWLRMVWLFYGVTLIGSLVYIYYRRFASAKQS